MPSPMKQGDCESESVGCAMKFLGSARIFWRNCSRSSAVLCGPITAIPLLLFAAAAQRLPLFTLGLLQYLTPAMQMTWGVVIGHEPMPVARWLGFALIWVALAVFTVDAVARARRPSPAA